MSKTSSCRCLASLLLAACALLGQTPAATPPATPPAAPPAKPAAPLAFEVAAIKPSPPLMSAAAAIQAGKLKVGMTVNSTRVDIGFLSLADLIRLAYKVKSFQISGPDWMPNLRFEIQARMPEGATKEQVPEMLQALLAERFKLALHHDTREHSTYALVVAKGGAKLKDAPPDDAPPADGPDGAKPPEASATGNQVKMSGSGENRTMTFSGGSNGGKTKMTMGPNNSMHLELSRITMEGVVEIVGRFVDRPIVDMTELKGTYQFSLDLSMEDLMNVARQQGMMVPGAGPAAGGDGSKPADTASDPSSGSIFTALQQYGLKLEPRKAPIDLLVIDHLEKTPTEN